MAGSTLWPRDDSDRDSAGDLRVSLHAGVRSTSTQGFASSAAEASTSMDQAAYTYDGIPVRQGSTPGSRSPVAQRSRAASRSEMHEGNSPTNARLPPVPKALNMPGMPPASQLPPVDPHIIAANGQPYYAAYMGAPLGYPLPPSFHVPDASAGMQSHSAPVHSNVIVDANGRRRRAESDVSAEDPAWLSAADSSQEMDSPANAGSRQLKTSRRAVQNRLAQRAFRERRDGYVRDLEERSRALDDLQATMSAQEGRRLEVEERAKFLADRAMTLDAQEQRLRDIEAGRQPSLAKPEGHSIEAGSNQDTDRVHEEIVRLRRELSEREAITTALRRALEEVSADNGRLRRQVGGHDEGSPSSAEPLTVSAAG